MSVGLGIVSFAHGHVGMYAREIAKMDGAKVVACWDDDAERGKKQAATFGCVFESDLDALLARADVQAVMIASETSKHAAHAVAAARAGKHILLQKPMAINLQECDEIIAAVKKAGVRFSMAWQMRCDPQNEWMREKIKAGTLGKITMVRRRHGLPTQAWGEVFANSWHVKPEMNIGMFFDDASHAADWLLWTFGKPESVTAEISTVLNPKVPDDNGVAVYRYACGMIAVLECSFTCLGAEETTLVCGEKGNIVQKYGDAPSANLDAASRTGPGLKYLEAGQKTWTAVDIPTPAQHGERIGGVAKPAVAFLAGKGPAIATAEEGRTAVEMILAAYASAREGRRVSLST